MMKMSLVALFAVSALAISAAPVAVRYTVAPDGNEALPRS